MVLVTFVQAQIADLPPLKDGGPIEATCRVTARNLRVTSLPPLKDGGPIEANARATTPLTGLSPFLR